MKNLKMLSICLLFSTITSTFACFDYAEYKMNLRKKLFIIKKYESYKMFQHPFCGTAVLDYQIYRGLRYDCYLKYTINGSSNNNPSYHANVAVYYTKNKAKIDFIRGLLANAVDDKQDITVLTKYYNKNRTIRFKKGTEEVESTSWVSGNKIIRIGTVGTTLCNEIINDYLSKYPPTVTFLPEDLMPEAVMKAMIAKRFEQIADWDKGRKGAQPGLHKLRDIPKFDRLVAECGAEMHVRCMIGMLDDKGMVHCPITEIEDDAERTRQFTQLKQSAASAPLDYKRFSFTNPEAIVCPHDGYLEKPWLDEKAMLDKK